MPLEGLTLNGLSLNNGTTHMLTALQLPIPAKKPEWVEGADANGAVLMRDPLVENGTLVATVDLIGSTKAQALSLIGAIVDELEEADRNPAGVPVVWTPAGGGLSMTFYALSGEVTQLENDIKFTAGNVPTVQVTLKCRPGGYGALVTGPSQTTSGPVVQLTVPDVPGDMPTDEAYIVVTDQSSQSRRHVEWGAEWLHYNASASLLLDSDSLFTSGYSGAFSTFGVGGVMYDPNATGVDSIFATGFPGVWQTMLSTGAQSHVGTFRVKARVVGSSSYAHVRLAWRAGDGTLTINDEVYVECPSANYNVRELDLGLVSIPGATAGTQSWEGLIQLKSATAIPNSLYVDYLVLIPVEAGYGRARGETVTGAGTVTAYDVFNQTAGALNGKTAALGGTWATSGSGTEFQASGATTVTRAGASETALGGGRYALLGSTSYTDTTATMTITGINATVPEDGLHGLILRYVDANNWLGVFVQPGLTALAYVNGTIANGFVIIRRTGGAMSRLTSAWYALGTGNVTATLTASVNTAGAVVARAVLSTVAGGSTTLALTASDSSLRTGNTLGTGKVGMYSERHGAAVTYTFDTFVVSSPPALTPAMYSSRTLEVTGSETRRQNSAGTLYGRPASYRGSRFVLNPEGSAGRSTRILAKAHRNDVDVGSEALPVTDSLKLQVFYRPRYSVVPR